MKKYQFKLILICVVMSLAMAIEIPFKLN